MGRFTKREIEMIVAGALVVIGLGLVGASYFVRTVAYDSSDPLTKAGGLKPDQATTKMK
jgi:hypothetical protein